MTHKAVRTILCIVILVPAIAILWRNAIIRYSLEKGIKSLCGLDISISKLELSLTKPEISVLELSIHNPNGFPGKEMAIIPELLLKYDWRSFLASKQHFYAITLHLAELNVVRTKGSKLNLDALTVAGRKISDIQKNSGEAKGKPPEFMIDVLDLKIDRLTVNDYSQDPASVRKFDLGIDRQLKMINDPAKLTCIILFEALKNVSLNGLFNVDSFSAFIQDKTKEERERLISTAAEDIIERARKRLQETGTAGKMLNGILGSIEENEQR